MASIFEQNFELHHALQCSIASHVEMLDNHGSKCAWEVGQTLPIGALKGINVHQKLLCKSACKCSRSRVRVLETRQGKCRVRSLSSLSGSFTVSLRSTNLPTNSSTFIKKSHKHANCLLSRSCLLFAEVADIAIIGPHLLAYTHTNTHMSTRVQVRAHASRVHSAPTCDIHALANCYLATCQVTREQYCKCR